MNSVSAEKLIGVDPIAWRSWGSLNAAVVPRSAGVYVLRMTGAEIGRVKGMSDIIYIGKSRNLRRRLGQHMRAHDDTRNIGYRISRIAKELAPLEVGWKCFADQREASNWEIRLLERYADDHIEFPPLNRQQAGEGILRAARMLSKYPPDEIVAALKKMFPPENLLAILKMAKDQKQETDCQN
jgi:hypothetical protein